MRTIPITNEALVRNIKSTFINSAVDSTDTTLSVESIVGFGANQLILIGELGNEKTEIAKTHSTTAPSGSTITLSSELSFSHNTGTKIYILNFDEIEISWSLTEDGEKEVLSTISVQADQKETLYEDTSKAEGYYFIRFKNSITDSFSDYSDPVPWGGYSSNTVGSIIQYALKRNKLETFTKFIDYDFCIEEINSCLKYIVGKKKKWTHLQDFDYALGTATRGEYSMALPDDVWNKSHKAILDVRTSGGLALRYKDKKEFNDLMYGVQRTTASAATAGDTTLTVTDATHLEEDGIVMVNGMLIEYDEKDGNELKGIPTTGDGSITTNITAGDNVWQGSYQESSPYYFTVYGGNLYWWPMTSSTTPSQNIIVDFWTEAPEIESDSDELDIHRYDMVKHWLTWAIKMQLKNDGTRDFQEGDYVIFREILLDAMRTDIHGQTYKYRPALNTIKYPSIRET